MNDPLGGEKARLRAHLLAIRRALDPALQAAWSRAIADRLADLDAYRQAGTIHCYVGAVDGEVATRDLVAGALAAGKRVACPRVVWNPPRLEAYVIEGLDELAATPRGLWEPAPAVIANRARAVAAEAIDLVIVPGLAFDAEGHRLGFGAGLYDRFLAGRRLPTAALAFSLQVVEAVPHTHHDVPMDWIVTEAALIACGTA